MTAARFVAALLSAEPAPEPSGAHCVRCKRWTCAPVPVRYIERASGPGVTLYACPSHAVAFGAGPTPEDELHTP
ncbi:hypothetical protein GCM10010336_74050 [Streptomyces goshikiensis]|nr:hypothetical protein [Streptomyces goshikiensis]GHD83188.1 hypothetical protein GCM10010336_74050 [Streptomyces goshikiensis]